MALTIEDIINSAPAGYPLERVSWAKQTFIVGIWDAELQLKKKFSVYIPKGAIGVSIRLQMPNSSSSFQYHSIHVKSGNRGTIQNIYDYILPSSSIFLGDEFDINVQYIPGSASRSNSQIDIGAKTHIINGISLPQPTTTGSYIQIEIPDAYFYKFEKIFVSLTDTPELDTTWVLSAPATSTPPAPAATGGTTPAPAPTDTPYPEPDPIISPLELSGLLASMDITQESTTLIYTVPEKKKATINIDACVRGAAADLTFYVGPSATTDTMIKATNTLPHNYVDEFKRDGKKSSLSMKSILMSAGEKLWMKVAKGTSIAGGSSGGSTVQQTPTSYVGGSTVTPAPLPAPSIGADGRVVNAQDGTTILANFLNSIPPAPVPSTQNITFVNPFQVLLEAQPGYIRPPTPAPSASQPTTVIAPAPAPQPTVTPPRTDASDNFA